MCYAFSYLSVFKVYNSTSERSNGFKRVQYFVAFSVQDFRDRVVLLQAGAHDMKSHDESKGILSVKQRGAVERSARAAPLALGSQVHECPG